VKVRKGGVITLAKQARRRDLQTHRQSIEKEGGMEGHAEAEKGDRIGGLVPNIVERALYHFLD